MMDFPRGSANNAWRNFSYDDASRKSSNIHQVNDSAKSISGVSIDQLLDATKQPDATSFKKLLDMFGGNFSHTNNEASRLLHATIRSNTCDFLEALINSRHHKSFDFEARDSHGQTPLVSVVKAQVFPEMVGLLVAAGAKVNAADGRNETPLQLAVSSGNFPMAKALIDFNADVNIGDVIYHKTPIFSAVALKDVKMMRLLIDAGANVAAVDKFQGNPLICCISFGGGNSEVIDLLIDSLLKSKGDIDARDANGDTALMKAIRFEHPVAVISLLNAGASLQTFNDILESPLRLAARHSHRNSQIVKILIDAGAGVNVKCGRHEQTALFDAVIQQHPVIVAQLLDAGANVNIVDGRGYSALTRGVENRVPVQILEKLVAAMLKDGEDIDAVHENASKALRIAIGKFNSAAVEALLYVWQHLKPDEYVMNAANHYRHLGVLFSGMGAGFEVSEGDLLAALQKELEKSKADIAIRRADGGTLLMDAAKRGFNVVAEFLLRDEEYIDMKDSRGRNAVMYAAENGNLQLLEMLRLAGANLHAIDNDGANAGLLAAYAQHSNVMAFFAARGALF